MIMEDGTYGDNLVDKHWNIDGPHGDHTTTQAGRAIAQLMRFLNHATAPWHAESALPWAATGSRVVGSLRAAAYDMPRALEQLAVFFDEQASNPLLYDDRRHNPNPPLVTDTTSSAAADLRAAARKALELAQLLKSAFSHTDHLGEDDPPLRRLDAMEGEDFG
jgi:hypothetical protein